MITSMIRTHTEATVLSLWNRYRWDCKRRPSTSCESHFGWLGQTKHLHKREMAWDF